MTQSKSKEFKAEYLKDIRTPEFEDTPGLTSPQIDANISIINN